ncbi:hypothetical protein SPRG_17932 [Saprolegnia parasitica CBS 223.65]|uniref:Uncharacterized protein n=1 Tax=Saprolegnia parasitica (strain CBS 223.65) TaxID=695850 RepID=A0A067BQF3_SAPPC|nr:hypothetical protein SPRG_17932 [Saprolegnia parasitica CBS 223.65]KDO16551.1 hypothetical protein SPRG_17932 [Saprolegnia parasitica CBS 223.65]|eukprot:XP_012212739.1 hypothetical protein SPRG_17932 [Saprolegnia parasitica CBS 223.65]
MRYVATYLLLSLQTSDVTREAMVRVLAAANVDIDHERLDIFWKAIQDKDIDEVLAHGWQYHLHTIHDKKKKTRRTPYVCDCCYGLTTHIARLHGDDDGGDY